MNTMSNKPQDERIFHPHEFDLSVFNDIPVQKMLRGNQGTRQARRYLDIVTAFDIETTRIDGDQSIMYVWQWQIGHYGTVIGRTWDELKEFISDLLQYISAENSLVVLIHNASYEFQFLRAIYGFSPDEVFCIKSRKIAKFTMYGKRLEFRCTLFHSNMSLAEYTKKMQVKHIKLSGDDFDYDIQRYPWTELSDQELAYCQHDVLGLVEAYEKEMQLDGDKLSSVPLTSTGYVRRDTKRAMKLASFQEVRSAQPDERLYVALRQAFRGGDTHANRYYVGSILSDVKSADRSSSYPDVICNCKFPRGVFRWVDDPSEKRLDGLMSRGKALLIRVAFWGIYIIDPYWGFPYLSFSKCDPRGKYVLDNGRILSADYVEMTITDIDWLIIRETYSWNNIKILDIAFTHYGKLPAPLVMTTQQYYKDKTELKGIEEQAVYYTKQKNKLNAIYGMTAQDVCKQSIKFMMNDPEQFIEDTVPVDELLQKNAKRAFLLYQWGVWVTAWARYRLYEGICIAGEDAVYCDTDSVKYVGDHSFDDYNALRIADSKRSGSYAADKHGEIHYMGVMEQERTYSEFITQGAKKYAYKYDDGRCHVTCAGVNKKKGGIELEQRGGLAAFKPGFIFTLAGGTESVYNDFVDEYREIDGHTIHITPNVCIRPSTYTLSYTDEYEEVLRDPQLYLKLIRHCAVNNNTFFERSSNNG